MSQLKADESWWTNSETEHADSFEYKRTDGRVWKRIDESYPRKGKGLGDMEGEWSNPHPSKAKGQKKGGYNRNSDTYPGKGKGPENHENQKGSKSHPSKGKGPGKHTETSKGKDGGEPVDHDRQMA